MSRVLSLLFPPEPRRLPGRRAIKVLLRAVHVLCAGILTGAYVLAAGEALRDPWLLATIASGLLILLLDLHESGVFLLQMRGLFMIGKIAFLAALPLLDGQPDWILATVLVASVLSSHAPSTFRHVVPFGRGRFKGAETKG
jgi:hypothetical protein